MAAVQKAFDELARMVFYPDVSETQRRESRRMFYAGVMWLLMDQKRMAKLLGDSDEEEMKGARYLESIHEECLKFGDLIKDGKA